MTRAKRTALLLLALSLAGVAAVAVATVSALRPLPEQLEIPPGEVSRAEVVDRHGERLTVTYSNHWNFHDRVALHEVPPLLRNAVVMAEDRRFFEHGGLDWRARAAALWQNLRAGRAVRGASTISEQVVRMLHPRSRTLWSRWIEGFEAASLERRFSKGGILAFYLDQVPYAHQRRGVVQAARDLFGRDLDTLSRTEMLALAVLVRSPSGLDPRRAPRALRRRIEGLAERLAAAGLLPERDVATIASQPLELADSALPVAAPAFVRYARAKAAAATRIDTTLDARLQARLQPLLDQEVRRLAPRGVRHGAALVLDHRSGEVLAWLNARSGSRIDAVLEPRQPGSALKPFLYALALEAGWSAATLIDDSPTSAPVGSGLHRYRNYSRIYRGPVRLRTALANSLNVPAVRVMSQLPRGALYRRLRDLGFDSLAKHPDFYGEGLALGNGEVTLRELVSGYAVLARGGVAEPLKVLRRESPPPEPPRRLFGAEVASLVADILADADARQPEFGRSLDLPVPAAVKTGTSNDYRDSWAVGFSDHYTAGVWMGDLDRHAMLRVTGSSGPAVVLRAIFSELHRFEGARPLPLARRLRAVKICAESGALAGSSCPAIEEWFRPENVPRGPCPLHERAERSAVEEGVSPLRVELVRPTPGLHLAMDPRIPDPLEVFEFTLESTVELEAVEWFVDGRPATLTRSAANRWEWPLSPGAHRVRARVRPEPDGPALETREAAFYVR